MMAIWLRLLLGFNNQYNCHQDDCDDFAINDSDLFFYYINNLIFTFLFSCIHSWMHIILVLLESVAYWEIQVREKHHQEKKSFGYLWFVDICLWRAFLVVQCFPHMLQKWSLFSMWWPSMCFLMLIFLSVFPQATHDHPFPSTFFINFPISISRSPNPSWKVTPDLFPVWAAWKSWITDKMPPGLIFFCASTILFSPHAFI